MPQNWICRYCGQEFGPYMNRCIQHQWDDCPLRPRAIPAPLDSWQSQIEKEALQLHVEQSRN